MLHLIRFFRIRGASEKVARGFAVGLIVNFLPTFGFGVIFSGLLARAVGGNMIAGLLGGATLTFAWPVLFFLNLKTGALFHPLPVAVDGLADVTPKAMNALVWGQAFTTGAAINIAVAGLAVYFILRLLYHRVRPAGLAYFRRHARDHQRRFSRSRLRPA